MTNPFSLQSYEPRWFKLSTGLSLQWQPNIVLCSSLSFFSLLYNGRLSLSCPPPLPFLLLFPLHSIHLRPGSRNIVLSRASRSYVTLPVHIAPPPHSRNMKHGTPLHQRSIALATIKTVPRVDLPELRQMPYRTDPFPMVSAIPGPE